MKKTLASAVLALALVPGFDGVDGESTQKGHEGEIEAFNFSETFRQSGNTTGSASGGGAAGKFTPGPIVFTKLQGKASIDLIRACAKGSHFANVTITAYRQQSDGKAVKYYMITLKEVFVSAINEQSTGDALTDEVQLVFNSARWEVFDPPNAAEYDGSTGKVSSQAPATGRTTR